MLAGFLACVTGFHTGTEAWLLAAAATWGTAAIIGTTTAWLTACVCTSTRWLATVVSTTTARLAATTEHAEERIGVSSTAQNDCDAQRRQKDLILHLGGS
ncbi:hypothetical protein [Bythopirellula polymerisocia]|uniref:hypothetical protein n=1 Tax=Bythopirellula polymerisocia TaxID=2528003 RepID=UPI0011B7CB96|nr:hypothetical protein [Bythopirellula polymerisocia]